uniref:Ig-like domain-containing protein n=1 Tax=Ditylenchus dipsaci TaxID=166011 RepID=A0A915E0J7_9BILA
MRQPVPVEEVENGAVVFVEHPQSTYLVRSQPAQLTCKALNARRLRFRCNNKWLDESAHVVVGGISSPSQQPFLQASGSLRANALPPPPQPHQHNGHGQSLHHLFCCALRNCQDTSSVHSKTLLPNPAPERVPEGRTIQLPCVPPDADPKPEIIWRKDGQEISGHSGTDSIADSNLILASDGSLIISATRLSDSANYSCEAWNIANRRTTPAVQLLVYVDGQWSPWSPWQGACPSLHHTSPTFDCQLLAEQLAQPVNSPIQPLLPQQRRTRVCNNPAPLNDGAYCVGQDEQFRLCEHTCIINGGWSAWSMWSECNSQCQRLRNRECTAPAPVNGGAYCQGRDAQWSNCTDSKTGGGHIPSHCLPTTQMDNYAQPRVVDATAGVSHHQQLYVLASMGCVAFLLLVIAGLIAALLCRQKKGARKGCAKAMAISPAGSGGIFMEEKGEKLYFPVGVHDDELQHVRTVLLSQHQQRALLCDYSGANSPAKAMLTRASTPSSTP